MHANNNICLLSISLLPAAAPGLRLLTVLLTSRPPRLFVRGCFSSLRVESIQSIEQGRQGEEVRVGLYV